MIVKPPPLYSNPCCSTSKGKLLHYPSHAQRPEDNDKVGPAQAKAPTPLPQQRTKPLSTLS